MRRFSILSAACLVALVVSTAGDAQQRPHESREPELFDRLSYDWPFDKGPSYGDSPQVERPFRTVVGSFDLATMATRFPATLTARPSAEDRNARYFIGQLDPARAVSEPEHLLDSIDAKPVAKTPGGIWIVRAEPSAIDALQSSGLFEVVQPYHPALKLHPRIGRTPLADEGRAQSTIYRLDVLLWPGEPTAPVARVVEQFGGSVLDVYRDRLRIVLERDRLYELAHHDAIRLILEDVPIRLLGGRPPAFTQSGVIDTGTRPFNASGIDGGGAGGTGVCTIGAGPCNEASDCGGLEDVCSTAPQVLLLIDTGIQLDAGDLSDTRVAAGTAGPSHRKVRRYGTSIPYGGDGDRRGCDDAFREGTHGHFVAAAAVGNATDVDGTYGAGFTAADSNGGLWDLDGVAPRALVSVIDSQVTPLVGPCEGPGEDAIDPGDLYDGVGGGALEDGYATDGARVAPLAWGNAGSQYTVEAIDTDDFLVSHPDAVVFAAVGDLLGGTSQGVHAPATGKNVLAIGQEGLSEKGPAPGNRVAPQLLAYSDGLSGFTCSTSDDDQNDPVECTPVLREGSSVATAVAAGAALLVRDYFSQGFYPDGTDSNPGNASDRVPNISGALVKALLVQSATFTGTTAYRHNNEVGYGVIALANVLPLQGWAAGPTGLIVADGGIGGGVSDLAGLSGTLDATTPGFESATFSICDPTQELRVTLAWNDEVDAGLTGALVNDLDLELVSPGAVLYRGNYFTDDDDRNGALAGGEDCPGVTGLNGELDGSAWSLPTCTRTDMSVSPSDTANPIESILLSPDYEGDASKDPAPNDDDQLENGVWTLTVRSAGTGLETAQRYAVAVSGGLCGGSAVNLDRSSYACNQTASVTVIETVEAGDNTIDAAIVEGRLRIEVHDSGGMIDCEGLGCPMPSGLGSFQPDPGVDTYLFEDVPLTAGTARDPGNGALDVRHGDTIRVVYADRSGGVPDPDLERVSEAPVDCRIDTEFGGIVLAQYGMDASTQTLGGCERSARGLFEFGFPDRYLDADEQVILRFGFGSRENRMLEAVRAELRCVEVDDVSAPASCLPGTDACADPERIGNTPCPSAYLSIPQPSVELGDIPPFSATTANFAVQMGTDAAIPDGHEVEFLLEIKSITSGMSAAAVVVSRQKLDVDEQSFFYSTDYPTGGSQFIDYNNNEWIENPTTMPADWKLDYRFESRVWSDLTAGGTKNLTLQSPWNFDLGDGGFRSGIGHLTDLAVLDSSDWYLWGEDLNFNNTIDGFCSIGHCSTNGNVCNVDAQCGGGTCDPVPQGFCEIAATQCEANADCLLPGDRCDRFACFIATDCSNAGLTGLLRCHSPEDRNPANFSLDQTGYKTAGGCGWQTLAPGSCSVDAKACYVDQDCVSGQTCNLGGPQSVGGLWFTGPVDSAAFSCSSVNWIQATPSGLTWQELLLAPEIERVQGFDFTAELLNWSWNAVVDLREDAGLTWDFDPDTVTNDLYDGTVLNELREFSPEFGTTPQPLNGFPSFGPQDSFVTVNGSIGNNRVGANPTAFFSNGSSAEAAQRLAGPPDDDLNNGHCPGTPSIACTEYCDKAIACDLAADTCNTGTFRCSSAPQIVCSTDSECGLCVANPSSHCVADADCPVGEAEQRCSSVAGADAACIADGGICVIDSLTLNDCDVADTCTGAGGTQCAGSGASCAVDADCYSCVFDNALVDEYVAANGPIRNMDVTLNGGPDLRFTTMSDLTGPIGERFRAAIGVVVGDTGAGLGIGIDDMVFEWREFTLAPDATDCAAGSCATIDASARNLFKSNGELVITVVDPSPSVNDCNDDGDRTDPGIDDNDCDDDGVPDVRVRAVTDAEPGGEYATLNSVSPGVYSGRMPYGSVRANGLLLVGEPGVPQGAFDIVLEYVDLDNGTGQPCIFSAPFLTASTSTVQTTVSVTIPTVAENPPGADVRLAGFTLRDNGDEDGWADSHETVEMTIRLHNPTDVPLTGVRVVASSADPKIDCILDALASVGDLAPGETRSTVAPVRLRVSGIDRGAMGLGVHDPFRAVVDLYVTADQFDANREVLRAALELDLDAAPNSIPTTFIEGFESGTFGAFGAQQNDSTLHGSNAAADGYRCQYSNTDVVWAFAFGQVACYPGENPAHADQFHWQVSGSGSVDGGRGYRGVNSLYFGVEIDSTLLFTTPTGVLEGIGTDQPINLGWERVCSIATTTTCAIDTDCPLGESCISAAPVLSFRHQVSLMDYRSIAVDTGRSADSGVVQVQEADSNGMPIGDWIKVTPYLNGYQTQRYDGYSNCSFDPIDDGNDEDDFFDPTELAPLYGPSSTCYPEFVYTRSGDTEFVPDPEIIYQGNPCATASGGADGSGDLGLTGAGCWVESNVDLSDYRGKRIRVRFLVSALKLTTTWQDAFNYVTSMPGDDGWWIDDVTISGASTNAAALVPDIKDNSGLPGCAGCTALPPDVTLLPAGPSEVPGQAFSMLADGRIASCSGGVPLYRFWLDSDGNGVGGDPGDTILQGWSTDPSLALAPGATTAYVVENACSSALDCTASTAVSRQVSCPASANNLFPIVVAADENTLVWSGPVDTVVARGDLLAVSALMPLQTVFLGAGSSLDISADHPAQAQGFWYLFREDVASGPECNGPGTWSSGGPGEFPGREFLP